MTGPLPNIDLRRREFNPCAGKALYPHKSDATHAMRGVMCRRKNRPKMIRAYYCRACDGYHLTSKEKHP